MLIKKILHKGLSGNLYREAISKNIKKLVSGFVYFIGLLCFAIVFWGLTVLWFI